MPNCISNEPNYSGGDYSTASNGSSLGGYSTGTTETAYGYTVDFSGDWAYNASAVSSNANANKYKEGFKKIGSAVGMDWRLVAAVACQESKFNPTAGDTGNPYGLFQWYCEWWPSYAPSGKKGCEYRKDVNAQFETTKKYWIWLNNNYFKNIPNTNDRLALIIQSHHDGQVSLKGGVQWKNYVEKYKDTRRKESIEYLSLVINYYKQFCK